MLLKTLSNRYNIEFKRVEKLNEVLRLSYHDNCVIWIDIENLENIMNDKVKTHLTSLKHHKMEQVVCNKK